MVLPDIAAFTRVRAWAAGHCRKRSLGLFGPRIELRHERLAGSLRARPPSFTKIEATILAEIASLSRMTRRREKTMPTRNISITAAQDRFIDEIVRSGEYQNASEAIRDAVRALQQRRAEDAARIERLRAEVDIGIADLDRGDFIELDASNSAAFFEELLKEPLK